MSENEETANTEIETVEVVPEPPKTVGDAYADFMTKNGTYKSVFQTDNIGVSNRDIGISTGKISKDTE